MLLSLLFCITGTITTAIYTLSLHDALPISVGRALGWTFDAFDFVPALEVDGASDDHQGDDISVEAIADSNPRSEEHTSELQSRGHLVCRLLLEKKKLD